MALEMHQRLVELNIKWRSEGVEKPFRVRMGINTGFCNVGNFGSTWRMDYTIIGDEANLAARLQALADVERIVIRYETFALVQDTNSARALPAATLKGIGREITPYLVDGLLHPEGGNARIFTEHAAGLTLYLDLGKVDKSAKARVREALQGALAALDKP